MIDDLVTLLKFITDPETRETIMALMRIPSRNKLNWNDIKTASAKFTGNESFKVAGFANALIADLKTLEVSESEIKKFKIIFDELIRNAFEHGCKSKKDCKVSINCTYSRWFSVLQVSDTGSGFDFENAFVQDDDVHGLQLIKNSAYRFTANKKGNSLTALLMSKPVLEILPRIEKCEDEEILILTVVEEMDWYYMIADWEPLRRAVELASQKLILIDCLDIAFVTKQGRQMKQLVTEFKEYNNCRFAFVVSRDINKEFDFSRLNSNNFKVFDQIFPAKEWLCNRY